MAESTLTVILVILMLIGLGTVIKWIYKLCSLLVKSIINVIMQNKANFKSQPRQITKRPAVNTRTGIGDINYYKTEYFAQTRLPQSSIELDKGKAGEYAIYKQLQDYLLTGGKFLFNAYIIKDNNRTTELDVMLIHTCGIIVFESKNYSGWIYGKEDEDNWTETFAKGRYTQKVSFYNPILQNKNHIKALRDVIKEDIPIFNIIVFSDRCNLSGIRVKYSDIKIINLRDVTKAVYEIMIKYQDNIDQMKINELYNKLYPSTQVSERIKQQHVQDIKETVNKNI